MAESLMDKERHRWSYMTENQLTTRLKRITNPEKLRCFLDLADDTKNPLLYHLAVERAKDLRIYDIVVTLSSPHMTTYVSPLKKEKAKKVNTSSKKKTEDNIRTILI